MLIRLRSLALVFLFLCGVLSASPRTVSFDSGYLPSLTSNRAFWQFGIEYQSLGSLLVDGVSESFVGSTLLGRGLIGVGAYFGWSYLNEPYFVANHELGHGSRISALGFDPTYTWADKGNAHSNIFSFFLQGFSGTGSAFTSGGGTTNITPHESWSFSVLAGGVNNSSMYAEALEDKVAVRGGHFLEYLSYVKAKEDAYYYSLWTEEGSLDLAGGAEGDIQEILDSYAARGIQVSHDDIQLGSRISRWVSGTHWSYILGSIQYLLKGEAKNEALMLGKIRLPDISHYLNFRGASYKLRSHWGRGDTQLPFAIEYIYRGEAVTEFSLGYRRVQDLGSGLQGVS